MKVAVCLIDELVLYEVPLMLLGLATAAPPRISSRCPKLTPDALLWHGDPRSGRSLTGSLTVASTYMLPSMLSKSNRSVASPSLQQSGSRGVHGVSWVPSLELSACSCRVSWIELHLSLL